MISDSPGRETGAIVSSCDLSVRQGDTQMVRDPLIPRLLSVTDAADVLGCSRQYVNQLVREGKLPAAYAGGTIVLAEETVRRYQAGERFPQPAQLVISSYDELADGWTSVRAVPVPPDFTLALSLDAGQYELAAGEYRFELVDTTGKIMGAERITL